MQGSQAVGTSQHNTRAQVHRAGPPHAPAQESRRASWTATGSASWRGSAPSLSSSAPSGRCVLQPWSGHSLHATRLSTYHTWEALGASWPCSKLCVMRACTHMKLRPRSLKQQRHLSEEAASCCWTRWPRASLASCPPQPGSVEVRTSIAIRASHDLETGRQATHIEHSVGSMHTRVHTACLQ